MGKKGTAYERELKGILSGDIGIIEKFSRVLSAQEYGYYRSTISRPFMVIRAAGSFGVDLIAIRDDWSFPIEVKSSGSRRIGFTQNSARAQEQALSFIRECERAGVIGLYAFRLKKYHGDPWRMFAVPLENVDKLRGYPGYLYQVLPKISRTAKGNFVLVWDEGMPLSKFLSYVNLNYKEDVDGVEE